LSTQDKAGSNESPGPIRCVRSTVLAEQHAVVLRVEFTDRWVWDRTELGSGRLLSANEADLLMDCLQEATWLCRSTAGDQP
jgi:hypothetical protein